MPGRQTRNNGSGNNKDPKKSFPGETPTRTSSKKRQRVSLTPSERSALAASRAARKSTLSGLTIKRLERALRELGKPLPPRVKPPVAGLRKRTLITTILAEEFPTSPPASDKPSPSFVPSSEDEQDSESEEDAEDDSARVLDAELRAALEASKALADRAGSGRPKTKKKKKATDGKTDTTPGLEDPQALFQCSGCPYKASAFGFCPKCGVERVSKCPRCSKPHDQMFCSEDGVRRLDEKTEDASKSGHNFSPCTRCGSARCVCRQNSALPTVVSVQSDLSSLRASHPTMSESATAAVLALPRNAHSLLAKGHEFNLRYFAADPDKLTLDPTSMADADYSTSWSGKGMVIKQRQPKIPPPITTMDRLLLALAQKTLVETHIYPLRNEVNQLNGLYALELLRLGAPVTAIAAFFEACRLANQIEKSPLKSFRERSVGVPWLRLCSSIPSPGPVGVPAARKGSTGSAPPAFVRPAPRAPGARFTLQQASRDACHANNYCIKFNTGTCKEKGSHEVTLRNGTVKTVLHRCATCASTAHGVLDH
jgi:hypothetical protein